MDLSKQIILNQGFSVLVPEAIVLKKSKKPTSSYPPNKLQASQEEVNESH